MSKVRLKKRKEKHNLVLEFEKFFLCTPKCPSDLRSLYAHYSLHNLQVKQVLLVSDTSTISLQLRGLVEKVWADVTQVSSYRSSQKEMVQLSVLQPGTTLHCCFGNSSMLFWAEIKNHIHFTTVLLLQAPDIYANPNSNQCTPRKLS